MVVSVTTLLLHVDFLFLDGESMLNEQRLVLLHLHG
jgi:hypothetical protein